MEQATARLADVAGACYDEMASLPSPVPVHGVLDGAATGFAEELNAAGAEVLARYQHPHLGRWAAITTRGTVPDQGLAARPARWLAPRPAGGWSTDEPVTVSTSSELNGAGRLHVLHNWGWDEATARPSASVTGMLSGSRHAPGEPVTLGPWDVRLLRNDRC